MYHKQVMTARKRAQQRWHALMHRVKVNNGMHEHLGQSRWEHFEAFCIDQFRGSFLALFNPHGGVLRCSGPLSGGPCPHNHEVDLASLSAHTLLHTLHLDHAHDVQHVCEVWKQLTPRNPASWDEGIKGIIVAHLLFGTTALGAHASNIRLRCGASGARQLRVTGGKRPPACHKQHGAHYSHVLHPNSIRNTPPPKRQRTRVADDADVRDIEVHIVD